MPGALGEPRPRPPPPGAVARQRLRGPEKPAEMLSAIRARESDHCGDRGEQTRAPGAPWPERARARPMVLLARYGRGDTQHSEDDAMRRSANATGSPPCDINHSCPEDSEPCTFESGPCTVSARSALNAEGGDAWQGTEATCDVPPVPCNAQQPGREVWRIDLGPPPHAARDRGTGAHSPATGAFTRTTLAAARRAEDASRITRGAPPPSSAIRGATTVGVRRLLRVERMWEPRAAG